MVVLGEMGHFIPMVRIASALEEAGHTTVMISCNYSKTKAENIHKQNNIKGKIIFPDDISRCEFYHCCKAEDYTGMTYDTCMTQEPYLKKFHDALEKEDVDLVVCDFFSVMGQVAADRLGLPVVLSS